MCSPKETKTKKSFKRKNSQEIQDVDTVSVFLLPFSSCFWRSVISRPVSSKRHHLRTGRWKHNSYLCTQRYWNPPAAQNKNSLISMAFHNHDVDSLAEHGDENPAHLSHPRKPGQSGSGQELTKSHPRAPIAAGATAAAHPYAWSSPTLRQQVSHGRQEPPTLTNDTYPHNLALQPRGWLPSLRYPFSPSKYSHEFFLVSTPWYYIPKFFLSPLLSQLSQYFPFFNSLLAQPSQ